MQQIVRSAKGIGGAQGKYKNWGYCARGGLEVRPLENFNALKCIPRSSEALFRACYSTYIHTCKFCCRLRLAVSEIYDGRDLSRSINAKQKCRLT